MNFMFLFSKIQGRERSSKWRSRARVEGTVMASIFQLEWQALTARNGSPQFSFSPAISFFVNCETRQEVDELWEKLSEGGEKQNCG
jgi:predicted 3-demethylubiquinone-9 3-methyltransferase (glyoxalase superfamily)